MNPTVASAIVSGGALSDKSFVLPIVKHYYQFWVKIMPTNGCAGATRIHIYYLR